MGTLLVKVVILAGLDPEAVAYVAAAGGGDEFVNDGFTMLHFINGADQEVVCTIDSTVDCNQGSDHNAGGTIPVSSERMFGPFPCGRFNDANGKVQIAYGGAVVNLTLAAIRLKP